MVNASGPQELFIFALTRKGRVETTNYRTVRLASDAEVPLFVKDDFSYFYRSLFGQQVQKEDRRAVFLEYAWDMGWCDPCAADPLSTDELQQLGVFWIGRPVEPARNRPTIDPAPQNVFISRLHLRYDAEHFPEDLVFQETGDRENFQGRYILRHPWKGNDRCEAAQAYRRDLPKRFEHEAQTLASLTGWDIQKIRTRMNLKASGPAAEEEPWWKAIWKE
jgi:hypothetical protein